MFFLHFYKKHYKMLFTTMVQFSCTVRTVQSERTELNWLNCNISP